MTEPTKEQKPEQNAAKTDENAAKIGATLQDQLKDEDPQKVEEKKTDGAPKIEEKAKNDESLRAELAAQRSIRVLPKMEVAEDDKGEKLSACTENEWDASAEPFSAELLNVKNAPNKVSVFSGPCRVNAIVETVKIKRPAMPKPPAETRALDNRADVLAGMMDRVFNEIINDRDLAKITVTISTKIPVP